MCKFLNITLKYINNRIILDLIYHKYYQNNIFKSEKNIYVKLIKTLYGY